MVRTFEQVPRAVWLKHRSVSRPDNGRRERARVLRAVADGALAGAGTVNVDNLPPAAVDALARSESLRDFGNDRVAFRHDVLTEWAVSCLLSDLGVFDRLPLPSPAPAILARGVELAARFAIECSADSASWQQLLERVSREGVHGSWRRAALLALVRSEAAAPALTRASEPLLANHARLLRELIRRPHALPAIGRRSSLQRSWAGHSQRGPHPRAPCRAASRQQQLALDGQAAVVGGGSAFGVRDRDAVFE